MSTIAFPHKREDTAQLVERILTIAQPSSRSRLPAKDVKSSPSLLFFYKSFKGHVLTSYVFQLFKAPSHISYIAYIIRACILHKDLYTPLRPYINAHVICYSIVLQWIHWNIEVCVVNIGE